MTRSKLIAKAGAAIVWIYTRHLLTFAAGVIAGAVMGLSISQGVFVALLRSRGLL